MMTVNNIRADDAATAAAVVAYLSTNPDPGLRARPSDVLAASLLSGQALVVQDGSRIVGCSIIFKFVTELPLYVYSEIGSMRITANGLGLQRFIAQVHILQMHLEEDIHGDPSVFAIVSPGSASEHNLRMIGMEPWVPTPALSTSRAASGVPLREDKLVLGAYENALETAYRDLEALHLKGSSFASPKGGGEISLQAGWFESSLLAAGP